MPAPTVAIIQARCGSTRLPRKVLEPILDRPMLWWVVNRVRAARLVDEVVIATTDLPGDDDLAALCDAEQWPCFRGSESDVLDRYHAAATMFEAGAVVRITGDCPLIDPDVINRSIATFRSACPSVDYASNCQVRTFPRGLDAEVFSMRALERAWKDDTRPEWREHVTPYIYRSGRFRLADVVNPEDYSRFRWTVDTREDLAVVRRLFGHLGQGSFTWGEALEIAEAHPEWAHGNDGVVQKEVPRA